MKAAALMAISLALVASCSTGPTKMILPEDIVGEWIADAGFKISILPDDTYEFCDKEACFIGRIVREGASGVVLKNFLSNPATQRLRTESGFDKLNDLRGKLFKQGPDYDFSDNIGFEDVRQRRCEGRPCHVMGDQDLSDYTFIKNP